MVEQRPEDEGNPANREGSGGADGGGQVQGGQAQGGQAQGGSPVPGGELTPIPRGDLTPPDAPMGPPSGIDPEQLRQFQEFQRFEEFQRFQQAQREAGGELYAASGDFGAPSGAAHGGAGLPGGAGPQKRPVWRRLLGSKLFRRLVYVGLVLIALTWAYDHYFGEDDEVDRPAAETGGGKFETNNILPSNPYEAVRTIYDGIAQNSAGDICGVFSQPAQMDFAAHLGHGDCGSAVAAVSEEVDHVDDYASSITSYGPLPVGAKAITIDSCEFEIRGGPALGVFTLTKQQYKDQWLITGHKAGPKNCPEPSTSRTR